ncbi:MAG: ATP-binding protein, partial [Acidobacteriota bacterium]
TEKRPPRLTAGGAGLDSTAMLAAACFSRDRGHRGPILDDSSIGLLGAFVPGGRRLSDPAVTALTDGVGADGVFLARVAARHVEVLDQGIDRVAAGAAAERSSARRRPVGIEWLDVDGGDLAPWTEWLQQTVYRRALLSRMAPGAPVAVLVRRAARPFGRQARRFCRLVGAAAAVHGAEPPAPPDDSEIGELLSFSRRLAGVIEARELFTALGESLARLCPWRTLVLVPGPSPEDVLVAGGQTLDATARERLEAALAAGASTHGLPAGPLTWPAPAPRRAMPPAGEPWFLPIGLRGRAAGLLVILRTDPGPVPERIRRLVSGMAQQCAVVLERVATDRRMARARETALLDTVPCGVLQIDRDGRLCRVNAAGERLLGSMSGERRPVLDLTLADLGLHPDFIAGDATVELCSRLDQRTYLMRHVSGPAGGRGTVIMEDVSVDRAREEQARQTEKLSALGEMLSGVAHELNNPLSTVIGYAQLLGRQPAGADMRQRFDMIGREAERCRRIVRNLLDVARDRPPEIVPLNMNDLIDDVLGLFAYRLRVDGIDLSWKPVPHLPAAAGDRHRLQQVLVNLVANAHHALRAHTGPRDLRLEASSSSGRVRVHVTDSGPGIPREHRAHVFEPFFTTKEPGIGTGLGLPLAARILREHGGQLRLEPGSGDGASFVLDLPAVREATVRPVAAQSPSASTEPLRLLIVDDEASFRQLLCEALAAAGHDVHSAGDGAEALDFLRGQPVDLILSDLRMPVLSGRALFDEAARSLPHLAGRFVFMSGDVLTPEFRQFLERAGLTCLRKPFGLDELDRAIHAARARQQSGARPVVHWRPGGPGEAAPRAD